MLQSLKFPQIRECLCNSFPQEKYLFPKKKNLFHMYFMRQKSAETLFHHLTNFLEKFGNGVPIEGIC